MPQAKPPIDGDQNAYPRWFGSRYLLLRPLGEGGMGKVFLAYSGTRLCAVKVKRSDRDDSELTSRFLGEARLATKLSHRNLVYVTESGEENSKVFLAMEYVRGKTLQQILAQCARRRVALPLEFSLFVTKELLQALDYLHTNPDLQVTHRDMSPTNVMLSYDGSVKVIDFGLATWPHEPTSRSVDAGAGQRRYMAPEQLAGSPANSLSDLFSAGVLLWEMITGRPLFPDSNLRTAFDHIPAPSSVAPDIHPELDAIAATALAVAPSDRYQDAKLFIKHIDAQMSRHDNEIVSRLMRQLFAVEQQAEAKEEKQLIEIAEAMTLARGIHKGEDSGKAEQPKRFRWYVRYGIVAAFVLAGVMGSWRLLRPRPQVPQERARGPAGGLAVAAKKPPTTQPPQPAIAAVAKQDSETPVVSSPDNRRRNERDRPTHSTQGSPGSANLQRAASALDRAELLYRRDRLTEASFAARSALAAAPLEANLLLGKIYLQSRRFDESIEHFGAALRIDPKSATARAGMDLAAARKLGQ